MSKRILSPAPPFWNLPVCNTGTPVDLRVAGRDGRHAYTVRVCPGDVRNHDFIANCRTPEEFDGVLSLECEAAGVLDLVFGSDTPATPGEPDHPHRQQFHYTVPRGWQNDPNGLFHYRGVYHLFHQHDPFVAAGGRNPQWFHAVSRDLIHWEPRGVAVFPEGDAMPYSGCAIVDEHNVSGLQSDPGHPPILLYFTSAAPGGFTQNLAYSTDGGEHFRRYPENPLVPTIGDGDDRDPSVAFDPEAGEYLMCLFLGEQKWEFGILRSDDLLHWSEVERFRVPGGCECPDLFRIRDEEDGETYWVLQTATGRYQVGRRIDGRFVWQEGRDLYVRQSDVGTYAGQSFKHLPDGRRLFIAWHWDYFHGLESSQSMTLPVELKLRGGRLLAFPARELEALRLESFTADGSDFRVRVPNPLPEDSDLWEVELTTRGSGESRLNLGGVPVVFDDGRRMFCVAGSSVAYPDGECRFDGRIFLDRNTIEFFDARGRFWHCVSVARQQRRAVSYGSLWDETRVERLKVHRLKSVYASSEASGTSAGSVSASGN